MSSILSVRRKIFEKSPAGRLTGGGREGSLTQCILLRNRCLFFVAGEGFIHHGLIRLFGEQAHHRDDHKACQHGEGAAVDRGLQQGGESKPSGGGGDQI